MTVRHSASDKPFFEEWTQRAPGAEPSRLRSAQVGAHLGVLKTGDPTKCHLPSICVIGSQGKSTAALYAAAALTAAGYRTGLVTSPALFENRERIRIDGRSIQPDDYEKVAREIEFARQEIGAPRVGEYARPSGLFLMAALRHFGRQGVEVMVAEAGMEGQADDASLLGADIIAVTYIAQQAERVHGSRTETSAKEKLSIVRKTTALLVTSEQTREIDSLIREIATERGLPLITGSVDPYASAVKWPHGLSGAHARTGVTAASLMAARLKAQQSDAAATRVMQSVRTPGRLSVERDGYGRTWVFDAAVTRESAEEALRWTYAHYGPPARVIVCLPTSEDRAGVLEALKREVVVDVSITAPDLSFSGFATPLDHYMLGCPTENLTQPVLAIGASCGLAILMERMGANLEVLYSPRGV